MLDALLPHFTYRRHAVRTVANFIRGRASLKPCFDRHNWRSFRTYRSRTFECNVCGHHGTPFFDFPDLELRNLHRIGALRETLQCRRCGATMRHRTLAAALLGVIESRVGVRFASISDIDRAAISSFENLRVLDSDSYSPISRILRKLPNYIVSSYHPDREFDIELKSGEFNVNLERMGFSDASFDIVLSSDVMEHVRNDHAAHCEISRVLRPGGHYIFTVPYDEACPDEHKLVDTSGKSDHYLVPPQYHGDPISGGILAYRVYGRSIFEKLEKIRLNAEYKVVVDDRALILGGDVFVARRF